LLKINVDINDFCEICETPAGVRVWGDPAGALAPRRLPGTPAEREWISQKSTLFINRAFRKEMSFTFDEGHFFL
jgi:hypothetical protein